MLKFLIAYGLFLYVNLAVSQVSNSGSLFKEAQINAENKNYTLAIGVLKTLIKQYPSNSDYAVFLSRLYLWDNQLMEALKIIEIEWKKGNSSEENLRLYLQLLLANNNDIKAVELSEEGINRFPSEHDYYRLQKAIALEKQNKDTEALMVLEEIAENSNYYYKDAQYLKTQILQKQKNEIGVGYLNSTFSNPGAPPWHFLSAQYKREFDRIAVIGRINYGHLFGQNATQAEIDLYPKVGMKSYFYFNGGVSDGKSVFPLFRLGAEFYKESNQWSGSLGARYLHFDQAKVTMFTGHMGRNFGEYFIAYRPFAVTLSNDWFLSHIINIKKTFESKESFIQLDLQYGAVPYYFFVSNDFTRTNAYRAGINWRFRIKNNLFLQPIFMYEWEEFVPYNFRNRYNVQLNLFKRFK